MDVLTKLHPKLNVPNIIAFQHNLKRKKQYIIAFLDMCALYKATIGWQLKFERDIALNTNSYTGVVEHIFMYTYMLTHIKLVSAPVKK